jgi:hypothetical protein
VNPLRRWRSRSYVRRVSRAVEGWTGGMLVAYSTADRQAERLAPGAAPPRFAAEHERVLALEGEAHVQRDAGERPYPERTHATVAAVRALDELSGTLAASAADDAERAYAADLVGRLTRRRETYATAARNAQRAGDDVVERLRRTVPPASAAAEHAAVVAAVRAEVDARRAVHEATAALDAGGAERAARAYEERSGELRSAWEALLRRLGVET